MNTISTIFFFLTSLLFISKFAVSEPFVVLEYNRNYENSVDKTNNAFVNNLNYSKKHKVKKNETLSDIILNHYGNKNFNKDILSLSIVHFNKHAFVRKNPNYLFANKTLYLPSINEIKNLIIKSTKKKEQSLTSSKHIYFFGG
tara:strand:+ start:2390 stop:2818 length:429 start_codon:yes stop_codon:yes gene_type:complete